MRKILFLLFIVLLSAAWVAAQQSDSGPGNASGQSSPSTTQPPSTAMPDAGSQTSPSTGAAPSDQQMPSAAGEGQVIEGCLGGAAPDFTVTDKAGTVYKLDIPKDADTTAVSAHIGESVKVRGMVSGAGALGSEPPAAGSATATPAPENPAAGSNPSASAPGAQAASNSPSIEVEQMLRGTSTCPAGGSQPITK